MDVEDARTIGRKLRQIRKSRGKSLRVIAGLARMSKSQLDRIERGECALDKLSEIVALANALQIAPSELIRLPVPMPVIGHTDSMALWATVTIMTRQLARTTAGAPPHPRWGRPRTVTSTPERRDQQAA